MAIKFLVSYDIPQEHNPIRSKIAQILKDHGLERIEYSVFLGNMSYNEAEIVSLKLEKIVQKIPADIRLFALCNNCLKKSIIVKENVGEWNDTSSEKGVEFI